MKNSATFDFAEKVSNDLAEIAEIDPCFCTHNADCMPVTTQQFKDSVKTSVEMKDGFAWHLHPKNSMKCWTAAFVIRSDVGVN